jgi:hypothetical protein
LETVLGRVALPRFCRVVEKQQRRWLAAKIRVAALIHFPQEAPYATDLEILSGRSGFGMRLAFCLWRDGFKGQ